MNANRPLDLRYCKLKTSTLQLILTSLILKRGSLTGVDRLHTQNRIASVSKELRERIG